jgi:ABC-type uncharacterized transport system permease subunit
MIQNGRDPEVVHPVFIAVEFVDDWLEFAGYLLIGLAMVTLGVAADGDLSAAWRRSSIIIGTVVFTLAISLGFELGDMVDPLLLATGAVLVPGWAVWTARLLPDPDLARSD